MAVPAANTLHNLAPQCHKGLYSIYVVSVSCTKLFPAFDKPQDVLKTNFSAAFAITLQVKQPCKVLDLSSDFECGFIVERDSRKQEQTSGACKW